MPVFRRVLVNWNFHCTVGKYQVVGYRNRRINGLVLKLNVCFLAEWDIVIEYFLHIGAFL